ncbi:MAG TPA: M24 family metallopeptidase [Vicinamibacterales bacterium]
MSLDVTAVQEALRAEGLDGWLLYDFHGSNPIAARIANTLSSGKMTTRRWFYLIPASGEPRGLVHAIESHNLDALPGLKTVYAGREQLEAGLAALVGGLRRVAMEYSPKCAIPYISRVDAGTVELVRQHGVEVRSSGDLVQRFEARWDDAALATHRRAAAALYRIKDKAFEAIADRSRRQTSTTEYEIQQLMSGWFRDEGLVSDAPPVVAAQENAGNPHYLPTAQRSRNIDREELVLLDLWGKLTTPGAVYADITWVGFTGSRVPDEMVRAFSAICAARDRAVSLVRDGARAGRDLRGWQVDRAAREVLEQQGYAAHILHRTGHSLGTEVHGNGAHMDDFESHDERRLLPGSGFTVEPGLYFETFGVRTEVNVFVADREAELTGPAQTKITELT